MQLLVAPCTLGSLALHSFTLVRFPPGTGPQRDRLVSLSGILFPLVFVTLMCLSENSLKVTSVGKSSLLSPPR